MKYYISPLVLKDAYKLTEKKYMAVRLRKKCLGEASRPRD